MFYSPFSLLGRLLNDQCWEELVVTHFSTPERTFCLLNHDEFYRSTAYDIALAILMCLAVSDWEQYEGREEDEILLRRKETHPVELWAVVKESLWLTAPRLESSVLRLLLLLARLLCFLNSAPLFCCPSLSPESLTDRSLPKDWILCGWLLACSEADLLSLLVSLDFLDTSLNSSTRDLSPWAEEVAFALSVGA